MLTKAIDHAVCPSARACIRALKLSREQESRYCTTRPCSLRTRSLMGRDRILCPSELWPGEVAPLKCSKLLSNQVSHLAHSLPSSFAYVPVVDFFVQLRTYTVYTYDSANLSQCYRVHHLPRMTLLEHLIVVATYSHDVNDEYKSLQATTQQCNYRHTQCLQSSQSRARAQAIRMQLHYVQN